MRGMLDEPGCRCIYCYRTRMRYAAKYAKENGYDAFSTTLLVSPYQKHELIKNWQRKLLRNLIFRFIMKISARVTSAA